MRSGDRRTRLAVAVLALVCLGGVGCEPPSRPGDTGQAGLRTDRAARTRRQYRITLTDTGATVMSFYGYCIGYEVAGGNDEKVALSVTIEIDGEITWT